MTQHLYLFDRYQAAAHTTAVYPAGNLIYPVLGLVGEAGELLTACRGGIVTEIVGEAGDVMWYTAEVCESRSWKLSDCVAEDVLDRCLDFHSPTGESQPLIVAAKIAELYKKALRIGPPAPAYNTVMPLLGEMLMAICSLANRYHTTIFDIMEQNILKLNYRAATGTLKER